MTRLLTALALVAVATLSRAQEVVHDLIYLKQGGAAFTMDAFRPAKPNGMAVLWLVSGGWFSGHEGIQPAVAKPMTDRGITVFQVVHGSQPLYKIPQIQGQIVRAVRWVRANAARFELDPQKIGIAGGSAGGHLSLMTAGLGDDGDAKATDPVLRASSRVQAVVAYFPPVDFLNYGGPGRIPIGELQMLPFIPAFGVDPKGPKEAIDKRLREVSPIYLVGPAFPPTLLIHGDKDTLVPLEQSQKFEEALVKAGRVHKLVVVPGAGHGGAQFGGTGGEFVDWFLKHLGPK